MSWMDYEEARQRERFDEEDRDFDQDQEYLDGKTEEDKDEPKPRWWSEPDNYTGPTFREDDS